MEHNSILDSVLISRYDIYCPALFCSTIQYQYFTSGIRYYKFKMLFGIPRYSDQAQLTSYSLNFCEQCVQ